MVRVNYIYARVNHIYSNSNPIHNCDHIYAKNNKNNLGRYKPKLPTKHRVTVATWKEMSKLQRQKASDLCFRQVLSCPTSLSSDGTLTVPTTQGVIQFEYYSYNAGDFHCLNIIAIILLYLIDYHRNRRVETGHRNRQNLRNRRKIDINVEKRDK